LHAVAKAEAVKTKAESVKVKAEAETGTGTLLEIQKQFLVGLLDKHGYQTEIFLEIADILQLERGGN